MSDTLADNADNIDNALAQISAIADILQLISKPDTLDRLRVETLPTLGTILDNQVEEIQKAINPADPHPHKLASNRDPMHAPNALK
jgi:ABC-type transporter Mla subunit MlaD